MRLGSYLIGILFWGLTLSGEALARPTTAPRLDLLDCPSATRSQLKRVVARLPASVRANGPNILKIRCVTDALPFGFALTGDPSKRHLRLGRLLPMTERRASYRLDHLNAAEREILWHARGLVHLILRHGAKRRKWHLTPGFRAANGWSPSGVDALNLDPWGYSRKQGMQSALDDFATFGEEWFVRPPNRPTQPDNRVECQSFTKGRAFATLFEEQPPTGPPPQCAEFHAWSRQFTGVDLLFTSATDAPISSFGHLAILLHRAPTGAPEYADPVFQYVGLLGTTSPSQTMASVLTGTVPLVLQPQAFVHFDRQTRYLEDRSLHRYAAQLSEAQFSWLKARLWEQLRRFESRYAFTTENCARQVLRLFEFARGPQSPLEQPGITSSPLGVISQLQASGLLSRSSRVRPTLSSGLLRQRVALAHTRHRLNEEGVLAPPVNRLSAEHLREWSAFLQQISDESEAAFAYLHQAQDYYDLAAWQFITPLKNPIPIAPVELLALKRSVLREEKPLAERLERLRSWHQERGFGKRPQSAVSARTDILVEQIGDRIDAFEVDHPPYDSVSEPVETIESAAPAIWGADGALEAQLSVSTLTNRVSGSLEAVLYLETQGEYRSALQSPTRDLRILGMQIQTDAESLVELIATPIALHQRRGVLGFNRLGAYGYLRGGLAWESAISGLFDSALGPSVQLYGGADGRADLSLAGVARTGYHPSIGWSLEPLGIATFTVPFAQRSALRTLGRYAPYPPEPHGDQWSVDLGLEWGSWVTAGRTLTVYLTGALGGTQHAVNGTRFDVGFRWQ